MSKQRIDVLIAERNLTDSRSTAQRLILAGEVTVDGQIVDKPGTKVAEDAVIELKSHPRFVSRGGVKLDALLTTTEITVEGMVVADIGASTGGFTDCVLQRGAAKVYAIDVGYGQLAWKLRQDPRVVVMERTNARYQESLPEQVDFIVSDVSFISLRLIYATAVHWLKPDGFVISLIKPQFEAGRELVGKGGVVKDPAVHRQVLENVVHDMADLDLVLLDLMASPLKGPAGNVEFLGMWMTGDGILDEINANAANQEQNIHRISQLITQALAQAAQL
ncbi:MAG: TlyA family RNA methyltransferase [Anaerolineae bacterium]|nr:TlyA family RNA methyltransferase [Anaerolineae bacterium]